MKLQSSPNAVSVVVVKDLSNMIIYNPDGLMDTLKVHCLHLSGILKMSKALKDSLGA